MLSSVRTEIEDRDDALWLELIIPEAPKPPGGEVSCTHHASKANP